MEEESWPALTEYGTNIHAVFEDVFNDKTPVNRGLPDDIFTNVVGQVIAFKENLKAKYPGCKFYPELHIKTKWDNLSSDCQAALAMKGKKSIDGIIDLLVVDANGVGHIYDYKVSRKSIAYPGASVKDYQEAWDITDNSKTQKKGLYGSSKKLAAGYQVEIYKNILRQYGIPVSSSHIVPIKIDLEYNDENNPFAITNLTGVSVPDSDHLIFDPARKHKGKINNMFIKPATHSLDEIESMSAIYGTFFSTEEKNTKEKTIEEQVAYYKNRKGVVKKLDKDDKHYKAGEREYII